MEFLPTLPMETMVKDDCLELVYFDDADVYSQCNKQKNKTSSGPDGTVAVQASSATSNPTAFHGF